MNGQREDGGSAPVALGRAGGPRSEEPIGMLLACHQRIRSFSALAVRLAAAEDTLPAQRAEAAASVHRYFTVALPLHVADEEIGLRPRLLETPAREALAPQLARMSEQHEAIERRLAALAPAWSAIAEAPESRDSIDRARATEARARELERLLHEHLALEEEHLFPAAERHLAPSAMDALRDEMRDRRAPRDPAATAPLRERLAAEHARLHALLARATEAPGTIDRAAFEELREGLLRHIGIEEKVLLPAARRLRGGAPLPLAPQLRRDHAALAALLVPTPTAAILDELRALLTAHDALEEGPGGLYESCDRLAAREAHDLLAAIAAARPVPLAPHFDGARAFEGIERLLRAAGRRS